MVVKLKHGNGNKKDSGRTNGQSDGKRKPVKYVYPASRRVIFLVTGEPKESQYSYGVPIVPLYGKFRAKDGKVYDADELRGEKVVLNVSKDDGLVDAIKEGVRLVVFGFKDNEIAVDGDEDEKDGGEGNGGQD